MRVQVKSTISIKWECLCAQYMTGPHSGGARSGERVGGSGDTRRRGISGAFPPTRRDTSTKHVGSDEGTRQMLKQGRALKSKILQSESGRARRAGRAAAAAAKDADSISGHTGKNTLPNYCGARRDGTARSGAISGSKSQERLSQSYGHSRLRGNGQSRTGRESSAVRKPPVVVLTITGKDPVGCRSLVWKCRRAPNPTGWTIPDTPIRAYVGWTLCKSESPNSPGTEVHRRLRLLYP